MKYLIIILLMAACSQNKKEESIPQYWRIYCTGTNRDTCLIELPFTGAKLKANAVVILGDTFYKQKTTTP